MKTITASEALVASLRQADTLTEIRNSEGTLIGFFAPVTLEHAARYVQAAVHFDPQELRRRREAGGKTYTTQEVLAHLDSLEESRRASQ